MGRSRFTRARCAGLVVWMIAGLIGLSAACGRARVATARYELGQTAELDGWQISVHRFSTPAPSAGRVPQPGQSFCTVEVTIVNVSRHIRFLMPEKQMRLRDTGGRLYELDHDATVLAARVHQWLPPEGEVGVGAQLQGAVSYRIPAESRDWRLVFRSGLWPWSAAVEFSLGQPEPMPG